jgi:hypothetical protein
MAGNRKTRRATKPAEDLAKPSRWRTQHDPVTAPLRGTDPETGQPVTHRRIIDTLGQMLANGSITPAMHEAGCMFRTQFRAAMLDGMRVSALVRVSGGSGDGLTERQAAARHRVADVLGLFGGTDTACGSCLWHVVGMECSVREWAGRQGWGGRSINHVQGQGILVAALNVLAVHYGLVPRSKAA